MGMSSTASRVLKPEAMPSHLAAVVLHALHRPAYAFAGVDGGNEDQHILAGDHGRQVVTEDQLAVGVVLGGDNIDVFITVDGKTVILGEMTGQEGTQHPLPSRRDNGVHTLVVGAPPPGTGTPPGGEEKPPDQEALGGQTVTVCGWARTIRDMKTFGFIELNDGSCFKIFRSSWTPTCWTIIRRSPARTWAPP